MVGDIDLRSHFVTRQNRSLTEFQGQLHIAFARIITGTYMVPNSLEPNFSFSE